MDINKLESDQEIYKISLSVLSPLFIGSGTKYSQLDYIPKENTIHILDFEKFLAQIPADAIDDLTRGILENFHNNIWEGNVEEFLTKYGVDWKICEEKKYDLVGKIGKNEINQFIKTRDRIYIPGSSIKGAIRTAILFDILTRHPEKRNQIANEILKNFNDIEVRKTLQSEGRPDGKRDLLRALLISDFDSRKEIINIIKLTIYHLKEKKQTIPIFNEVLSKDALSIGTITINRKLENAHALFSKYFSLQKGNIINVINSFSKKIIDHELQIFRHQNDVNLKDIIHFYESLKNLSENLSQHECILRLGQGSSALGITLFLIFSDNKEIVQKYKHLEIITFNTPDNRKPGFAIARHGGITYFVDKKSKYNPHLNERWLCDVPPTKRREKYVSLIEKITPSFKLEDQVLLYPLTRKFAVSDKDVLSYPLGWVKLIWE